MDRGKREGGRRDGANKHIIYLHLHTKVLSCPHMHLHVHTHTHHRHSQPPFPPTDLSSQHSLLLVLPPGHF